MGGAMVWGPRGTRREREVSGGWSSSRSGKKGKCELPGQSSPSCSWRALDGDRAVRSREVTWILPAAVLVHFLPLGLRMYPPSFAGMPPACSSGVRSLVLQNLGTQNYLAWASQDPWELELVSLGGPRELRAWHLQWCPAEAWRMDRWSAKCTDEGGPGPRAHL